MDLEALEQARQTLEARLHRLGYRTTARSQNSGDEARASKDTSEFSSWSAEAFTEGKLATAQVGEVRNIFEALSRIEKGTYGICRGCGEKVAEPRLLAVPETKVCLRCKVDPTSSKLVGVRSDRQNVARAGFV